MRHPAIAAAWAATTLAAAACSPARVSPAGPDPARTPPPASTTGDTIAVRFGATATHAASGVRATFTALQGDSRCPAGVACVWEGDAVIRVRLQLGALAPADTTLHWNARAPGGLHAVLIGGHEVAFVDLAPAPPAGAPRPADAASTARLPVRRP
jgi:hypothetical protein